MRSKGAGSIYPIATPGCPHCAAGSPDHRRHIGRWQAQINISGRHVRRNAPTRTAAAALIDAVKLERHDGTLVVGKSSTLGAYLKTWIDERDPLLPYGGVEKLAYTTIGGYRRRAALLALTIGKVMLRELEPHDVKRALTAISAMGRSRTTVGDCRDFLATVLNCALRERPNPKVAFNAAALVDSIPRDEVDKYVLDETEAQAFLLAARSKPRFYAAMLVAIHAGPRAGELWGARWSAVDWRTSRLHISSSLVWIGAGLERARAAKTKDPKTEKGTRDIALGRLAIEALKAHRDAEAKRLGRVPHRDGYIWTDENGGPVDHRNLLRDVFYPVCEQAGIPYVGRHECVDAGEHDGCPSWLTFHGLRHSAITLALAETKDVIAVSKMAGHASTAFTMDVYGHVLEKQDRAIADYMDKAVHE